MSLSNNKPRLKGTLIKTFMKSSRLAHQQDCSDRLCAVQDGVDFRQGKGFSSSAPRLGSAVDQTQSHYNGSRVGARI